MKLKRKPLASAVAVALFSAVCPAYAQDVVGPPIDTQNSQASDPKAKKAPHKATAKKAQDKATAKQKSQSADTAKAPDAEQTPIILAQATAPAPSPAPQAVPPPQPPAALGSIDVVGIRQSLERSLETKRNADQFVDVITADDIITRKPLDFRKPFTAEAAIQAVYADLPGKTDPQFNGLFNWKNEANTMGVLVQGFYEKRHLRRDGQEILGYGTIAPTSALAAAHPDLANAAYPTLIGSSFFEQERERSGGLLDIQIKPTRDLSVDFNAFYSHLKATNYNRNWMFFGSHVFNGGAGETPTSYTLQNGTITSAVFPNLGSPGNNHQYAIVDEIYRPGAYSDTSYYNIDVNYRATDRLSFFGQIGYTEGKGKTPKQDVFEGDVFN